MSKKIVEPYLVLRDGREKTGYGWLFEKTNECLGTELSPLKTGDYTLKGLETSFCIERKATTSELANNIYEKRFEKELERLEEFKYPFMIFEFTWQDVLVFPVNSGIPRHLFHKVQTKSEFIQLTIARYMVQYKTKIIFAGSHGKEIAELLFKRVVKYGK